MLSPSFDTAQRLDVVRQLDDMVGQALTTTMLHPDKAWQPTDFLPELSREDALDQIRDLRERAAALPPEVITSLVGNMITEEALPSYQSYLTLLEGTNPERDLTSPRGWVSWSRSWTAEENRHGDLLNKYLYLSGRADMREVERTIQWLLHNGFNPNTDADPYNSMIYTSFQERATKISHLNTGRLADKAGDTVLARICRTIAGDEARHEKAYQSFMGRIFELDPDGALIAFETMMRRQITMPAALMNHGDEDLFGRFSAITQKIGIYTTYDYAAIIEHLVDLWKVTALTGLTGAAAKAQDYLGRLGERYRRIAERTRVPEDVSLVWLSQ